MLYNLFNNKNEKVLIVKSFSEKNITTLFEKPNFYAIFFFEEAHGVINMESSEMQVKDNNILFYYPYQKLEFEGTFKGSYIQFHPDFFCIDIHAKDVGCQGVLFNNFLNDTVLRCSNKDFVIMSNSFLNLKKELLNKDVGQLDMVSSQLKMLLICAVRIKRKEQNDAILNKENIHIQLEKLIEKNYINETSPEFYCNELNISMTTFNRLCKKYFKNSFVTIINLKKIASAKNQLFLTNESIKNIAYGIGFNDPLYFTRVFKKYSGISPKEFRKQLKDNRLI
ncbi:AraC-type DNA-binding protein [Tenacibaculum sp. 190130A14a]|uniref:AraC family transcriptional regulator, transcriptional activator of pobA n=1 Tax=Tenacibaculum polynesiense TaxID=3137857 RepID=A0ABM9PBU0_9FLAO